MSLNNQQTLERFGLTLDEWKALTPKEKLKKQSSIAIHSRKLRLFCDCGQPAVIVVCGEKICDRCHDIQTRMHARERDRTLGHDIPNEHRVNIRSKWQS